MAYTAYIALEGNIYTKIVGVTSETVETVATYNDGTLYDASLSAQFLGANTRPGVSGTDYQDPLKVAPVAQAKSRSRRKWTTGTDSFWAWEDQIICVSQTPFGYFGDTLPT